MSKEDYLGMIEKLNLLIANKILEKEELFTITTKITQANDGMPHASGTSDKVGNGAVKLLEKEAEINRTIDVFVDLKDEIIRQIQKLPTAEYNILYQSFVQGVALGSIADGMGMSLSQVKRARRNGINNIQILWSENLERAKKMLFQNEPK